nr:hypothetical protein [Tanacetum cinerariifolium]
MQVLPLGVYSPLLGAPSNRAMDALLQNKMVNVFKWRCIAVEEMCVVVVAVNKQRSSLSDSSSSNSRKDGASLSSDDEDEDEMTEGEEIFFSFSLLGFLEMSRGSMTCS